MNLIDKLNEFKFEVGEFGSCQYAQAHHVMTVFREQVISSNLDETIKNWEQELRCTIEYDDEKILLLDDVILSLIEDEFNEYTLEHYTTAERLAAIKEVINNVHNGDDLLECLRARSWTLWDAVNHVCVNSIIDMASVPTGTGTGPILNIEQQEVNILTGIQCAMLLELGIVKKVESFKDFDT